ncbi:MAG: hypothetical protein QM760_15305 [Nibricoccus sp.]
MKTSLKKLPVCFAGLLVCAAFVHAAPPEASQPPATSKEAWQSTKEAASAAASSTRDAIGAAWEKCKDATFKQREKVRESMKSAEAALDAKIVDWSAKKDVVVDDAKPAVAAAHKEVIEARAVLGQKIDALDNATEETWNSVKAELGTAWQRMNTAASDLAAKLKA